MNIYRDESKQSIMFKFLALPFFKYGFLRIHKE